MKAKRTHKLAAMGDAGVIVSASSSIADAAKKLGVERSTVHRWVQAGKVPAPRGVGFVVPPKPDRSKPTAQSVEEWAQAVRGGHELSGTDLVLLDLAVQAYTLAHDVSAPTPHRLTAMGRYQSLVRQLHLENSGKRADAPEPNRSVVPTRRVTHDPRNILQAVK